MAELDQDKFSEEDMALATMYAPVLYFHPAELFRPQSVAVMVNTAILREARESWLDTNLLSNVSISDLINFTDPDYMLDVWIGDVGSSDYKNYTAHRLYYENVLSPQAGGPPIVAYAHVVRDEEPGVITLQYWLFYYYNDWFNKHEGDWEMVEVILTEGNQPEWVVLSQHHGGTRRSWEDALIEEGTHPAVFVALGSHANYFWGDEVYWNGASVGNVQVSIMDRTGTFGRVLPEILCIPDESMIKADPVRWQGFEWIAYGGRWGELAPHADFSGPYGPAQKGTLWQKPYAWGMSQPLDLEIWYANRLRIDILGGIEEGGTIALLGVDAASQSQIEVLENTLLLHTDPPGTTSLTALTQVPPEISFELIIRWPDPGQSLVSQYSFRDLVSHNDGQVMIILNPEAPPEVIIDGLDQKQKAQLMMTESEIWDAPDIVWAAGLLPFPDILKGLVICLLAGWIPTLIYVFLLYQSDRYEKEPKRLLAAAFFWGSIPAILIAIATRIFFRLPVDMIGSGAIEAIRAGLVAPVVEEAVKGIVVLIIALRFRHEFDNVLDGIVYGAMVGFGFAMTGNILSYLGSFLTRGFSGLNETIFVEGILFGVNHGFYTAIYGAGLGYARLSKKKLEQIGIPTITFWLAVIAHAFHNLALHYIPGQTLLSAMITWLGVIVIVAVVIWSLNRQKQCLKDEMLNEIPEELYHSITERGGSGHALWKALKLRGLRGMRTERRLHQVCAELAFKKMQFRLYPEEGTMGVKLQEHRTELQKLLEARGY
ncbi:MAG: PrsW family intramembrane metalloprotease [Anaerolineales bacterium]|nr:PrsW family intramembrane metalloprotease [Anaerolineales bacterium]